jgi:hypothetical protein
MVADALGIHRSGFRKNTMDRLDEIAVLAAA